ncbi:MAG: hypothetical protein ABIQ12_04890, partial [Opitutaceae bacterium]
YDDAVAMLAWVESRSPEFRVEAVNRVQQRVRQLKDPNPTLLALAVIRWRAKDVATADSITQAIIDSSVASPVVKASARQLRLRFSEAPEAAPRPPINRPLRSGVPSLLEQARGTGTEPQFGGAAR